MATGQINDGACAYCELGPSLVPSTNQTDKKGTRAGCCHIQHNTLPAPSLLFKEPQATLPAILLWLIRWVAALRRCMP